MTRCVLVAVIVISAASFVPPAAAAPPGAEVALTGVAQVVNGNGFTCARLTSGQARCWGDNNFGQLGNGDVDVDSLFPTAVRNSADTANLTGVTQITAGDAHACAVLTSANLVCWGNNEDGQLGNDSFIDRDLPSTVANAGAVGPLTGVVEVSAGVTHTCARLESGQARCWGNDLTGQLGNNNASGPGAVRPVTVVNAAGTGPLTSVAEIDAGLGYSCARLISGQARCWGSGNRLGSGNSTTTSRPVIVVGVSSAVLTGITQLDTGWQHGCARLTTGGAVCWGINNDGRLGDGTTTDRLRPVAVRNPSGTGDLANVTQVAGGIVHSCARQSTPRAVCWGSNIGGALGDGNSPVSSTRPVIVRNAIDTAPLGSVAAVSAGGSSSSCARVAAGQLRCWGANFNGQIGDGTTNNSDLPVVVRSS